MKLAEPQPWRNRSTAYLDHPQAKVCTLVIIGNVPSAKVNFCSDQKIFKTIWWCGTFLSITFSPLKWHSDSDTLIQHSKKSKPYYTSIKGTEAQRYSVLACWLAKCLWSGWNPSVTGCITKYTTRNKYRVPAGKQWVMHMVLSDLCRNKKKHFVLDWMCKVPKFGYHF